MRVPHNKGKTKNPLGHSHAVVDRTCVACGGSFDCQVKAINRGGGKYCSKKCNPSYAKRFSPTEKARRHRLKKQYGLTPEQYASRVAAQGGVCAICKEPPGGKWEKLYVDHDHATGAVRGLLCSSCNRALGWFRDSTRIMGNAIAYLDDHARAQEA